jgi:hypothetical protein
LPKIALLQKLRAFPARRFENFVFDLLVLSGLRNPVWRTPGADAGRDIEGDVLSADMSEHLSLERWYIECKRYRKSVDWPAVFAKLAYASNHNADFLLFVTTGVLTPRAKEEISRRASLKNRPAIRVWDATVLEGIVLRHPLLLRKYQLSSDRVAPPSTILPLVQIASKAIQSAYGRAAIRDHIDPSLEFAAAALELMSAHSSNPEEGLGSRRPFRLNRDLYSWCSARPSTRLDVFDAYGMRALLSAVRLFSRSADVRILSAANDVCQIDVNERVDSNGMRKAINVISVMSDVEVVISRNRLTVTARAEG